MKKPDHEIIGEFVCSLLGAVDDAVDQGLIVGKLIVVINEILSDYKIENEFSEVYPQHSEMPANMDVDEYISWLKSLH